MRDVEKKYIGFQGFCRIAFFAVLVLLGIILYPVTLTVGFSYLVLRFLRNSGRIDLQVRPKRWVVVLLVLCWPVGIAYLLLKFPPSSRFKKRRTLMDESRALPFIERFVLSQITSDSTWPQPISIDTEDIKALGVLIQDRANVSIDVDRLVDIVSAEVHKQQSDKFWQSFRKIHSYLPSNPTRSQMAAAYVSTFGSDTEFIPYLVRSKDSESISRLHEAVKREALTRFTEELVEDVADVIDRGVDMASTNADHPKNMEKPENDFTKIEGVALPLIEQFVAVYISPDAKWPQSIRIDAEDIRALRTIIEERVNIFINIQRLADLVSSELHRQQSKKFWQSLREIHPDLPSNPTLEQVATAYVSTFEHNTEFIPYLVSSKDSNTISKVQAAVLQEIHNRTHEKRVEAVARAMDLGQTVQAQLTVDRLDSLSGREFESFLGRLFSNMGYSTTITKASGDQGVDLIIEKFGDRIAVQAKRYQQSVGNKAIQEVIAGRDFYGCHRAMVVTTSSFTQSAVELARRTNVILWDRNTLGQMLANYM